MKKEIGILTFHSAVNYGAALQAIALKGKLQDLGLSSELIDYRNQRFEKQYGLQTKFQTKSPLKKAVLIIVKNFFFYQKKAKFKRFLKVHGSLSNKRYHQKDIADTLEHYEYIMTGSDQVWNLSLTDFDLTYFLDFVPTKRKRSFAASFGFVSFPDQQEALCKQLLAQFPYLSVREKSACELCASITDKKIMQHIDPTLLYTGKEWERFCKPRKRDHYILLYKVAAPVALIGYLEQFAKEHHYQVIEIGAELKKSNASFHYQRTAGPADFLTLIAHADYVATTSFHAAVFSILFHKKLIVELMDATGRFNTRIANLFEVAQLPFSKQDTITCIDKVDWERVDHFLHEERQKAISYLMECNNDAGIN